MTAKEIKNINREIARLKAKIIRIQAEVDNISPKLSDLPSASQTSDKVGNAVVQIADVQRDIQNLEIRRNSALNSLSRDNFVETIHGVNGILIEVRNTYWGSTAFIATADGRTFYCPVTDLKNCRYTEG